MSSKFRNSVAIFAIVAGLGGAAIAQTATQAPAEGDARPAPVTITEENLPDLLKSLNLQNIDIDQERRHTEVEGTLEDGTQIEAKLGRDGQLRFIEADDDAALPVAVIDAVVPQSVRDSEIFGQFSVVEGLGVSPADAPVAGVMVKGVDANGEDLRAAFSEDGTLMRFGRGDDDHGKHGKRGGDHGKRGDHGDRDGHGKRGERGDRGDQGMRGDGRAPAPLDEAAVTTTLTDAGYTDLGTIAQDGPRTSVEAVNANGENVVVELNPRGEVVRETAR